MLKQCAYCVHSLMNSLDPKFPARNSSGALVCLILFVFFFLVESRVIAKLYYIYKSAFKRKKKSTGLFLAPEMVE